MESGELESRLAETAEMVTCALGELLDEWVREGELARPERLMAAMRHGVLNGGKRLRPFLVIESAALFGVTAKAALPAALALECVHCYSLIHDDLPAMDDDDLRRGKPTVHKAFDDATAILAGDSLLTLAFEILGENAHESAAVRSALVVELARAAGLGGMTGGQMLDLQAEKKSPVLGEIRRLQAMKTGALIRFACEAGAILGSARPDERLNLRRFGEAVGAAFQLADDLLDVTSTSEAMGKKTGKDSGRGKGTLVSLMGAEEAAREAVGLVGQAERELVPFGERAAVLAACARYSISRAH